MYYDYIIVGAGISGLTIYKLIKDKYPNKKIKILEWNNRIGGRIYNEGIFELGAKFLEVPHNVINKLYKVDKSKLDKIEYLPTHKNNLSEYINLNLNKVFRKLNKSLINKKKLQQ
jgi:UDP-galactopyranose mutase